MRASNNRLLGRAFRRSSGFILDTERETAPVIGLGVERRSDVTRHPLQQPPTEPRFELLYGVRHRRARQAEMLCGEVAYSFEEIAERR